MGGKPSHTRATLAIAAVLLLAGLPSLVASGEIPILEDPAMEHVDHVEHGSAAGLFIHGEHAYVSGLSAGFYILDISDPEDPVKVSELNIFSRDADILETDDGRTVAVLAAQWSGIHLVDVTDPTDPTLIDSIGEVTAHNAVVLEGTGLIYNSRSFGSGVDIIDASNPENARVVRVWDDGFSCHDITAYPEADRAYCAGLDATYVLDISDRLNPETLVSLDHTSITLHHWALADASHNLVLIGDERFAEPDGCEFGVDAEVLTISERTGALWVYDITVPDQPILRGWVSYPGADRGACTAHFGEIIEGTSLVAVGWYTAGVLLIDYGDPGLPRLVEQWDTPGVSVWDVRHKDGYLYTGDMNRGTDVLKVERLLGL